MKFDLPRTAAAFVVVLAIGVGVSMATPMATGTVLMMVLPSMVAFGLAMLALGVKHGEYRATRR
ncbi:DUF7333 family protein [Halalkalicoccus ordinarius]|uniref:DUF7333 family protein n=1 Tax=Halalkalicoccus ordinarius TaxID=3116651 RepID=UPI00300E9FD1